MIPRNPDPPKTTRRGIIEVFLSSTEDRQVGNFVCVKFGSHDGTNEMHMQGRAHGINSSFHFLQFDI